MSYLIKSATVVTFDPPVLERTDLRISGENIVDRKPNLEARDDDEVIDLSGKLVLPGMVCAHTHLYSTLARGMPAPPRTPGNFREILELVWWRLDRALDDETIYWSALAGAMEAARAGTTCLFDHHASPSHINGSLDIVRDAVEKVGLRAVLCYEVTDRGGTQEREKGLDENLALLRSIGSAATDGQTSHPLIRGMVGAHASFTLSDESIDYCAELMQEFDAGLHIHVAEDKWDVMDAQARYKMGVVERLARHRALNNRTILAHGIHLSDEDIGIAKSAGVWFAHNPRSNMNNNVGYAPVSKLGNRVVLGTDGIGADMFEETHFAFFKGRDAIKTDSPARSRADKTQKGKSPAPSGSPALAANDWLRVLANNQRLASQAFGFDLGTLEAQTNADLIVLDYKSITPITPENLAWHLAFGMNSATVESVMVNGKFVIRERRSSLDDDLNDNIRKASEKLWSKL